jgi:hypothetical protein
MPCLDLIQDVVDYPWERKTPKALMRAAMQVGSSLIA